MNNLIFIEGISGVGKSTITQKLHEKLCKRGYKANCYLEGDIKSPFDSFGNAYLTKTEYKNIKSKYPDFAEELTKNNILEKDYCLVRYHDLERRYYSAELYEYLKTLEFCYNPINPLPLLEYTNVFTNLWRKFAEDKKKKPDYVILDGSLLHHQINDLLRNYNVSEDEIVSHLSELLKVVQPFNPVAFYLSSQDVRDRLTKARESRGQTIPTEEQINYWQNRKNIDLRVLNRLSVESYILDITHNNWNSALNKIFLFVTKNEIKIQKITKQTDKLESKTKTTAILAEEIWREYYISLIGEAQVEYMLTKFQSAEQICTDIKQNGYIYFTAENITNGEIIGYSANQPKEGYLLLSKLYVRKDYRGKGIARRFLDESITLCREYGFDKVRLTVNKYNSGSIAAYKKMGFEIIDSIETDIGGGFIMDDYLMELAIINNK